LTSKKKLKNQRINVFNRQRKLPVNTHAVISFLEELADYLELKEGFTIVLVSDRAMRGYNRRFAGKAETTDVLSFPVEEDYDASESYLGDILISVERAREQLQSGPLEEEIKLLGLHGVLHLLGYDHQQDSGEMVALERKIRRDLGLTK